MESRRIVAKQGSTLTLDRALKRNHATGIAVALHTPILSPRFERLGGVDEFEPVSGGGEVDHAEEAIGQ